MFSYLWILLQDKLNVDQRQHEVDPKNCSSVDDAKHEENNQHECN